MSSRTRSVVLAALLLGATAALLVPGSALAAANIVVDPLAPTFKQTRPGVPVTLNFLVRNTGDAPGAVTFAVETATTWGVSYSPTDATVPAGGSQSVTVTVTPTGVSILESSVILRVSSGSTFLGQAAGFVRVPVFLSSFDQDHKTLGGSYVRGNVTARFLDGSPASGVQVGFTESLEVYPTNHLPSTQFGPSRQTAGTVGATGKAAYAYPASATGSTMIGYHRLTADTFGVVNDGSSLVEHYFWSRR